MNSKLTLVLTLGLGLISGTGPALAAQKVNSQKVKTVKKEVLKPIVAVVKADWCPACARIEPTLDQLSKKYNKKTTWLVFDVTNQKQADKSSELAKKMGLDTFYSHYGARTSTVAIIHPTTKKVIKLFMAEKKARKYIEVLEKTFKILS